MRDNGNVNQSSVVLKNDRNEYVDVLRGIAILLVVLGHTMSGSVTEYENSFIFGIVWSIQMPLFILISGYVTKYSKTISSKYELLLYIKKRSISYLLPWFVWSFVVRGVFFGQEKFLDLKYLLWNMDSGYWFLITIWTISIIFGIASFISEYYFKSKETKKQICKFLIYLIGMSILICLGMALGITFMAIKLTLYYMPFYYAGYLYGQFDRRIRRLQNGQIIIDSVVAICLAIWTFFILNYSIYNLSDSGIDIIIRAFISLSGCIALSGICHGLEFLGGGQYIQWMGKHSLEIYLAHYLLLIPIKTTIIPELRTVEGTIMLIVNYVITIVMATILVKVLNLNFVLKGILFAKK